MSIPRNISSASSKSRLAISLRNNKLCERGAISFVVLTTIALIDFRQLNGKETIRVTIDYLRLVSLLRPNHRERHFASMILVFEYQSCCEIYSANIQIFCNFST